MENRTSNRSPLTKPGMATVREIIAEIRADGAKTTNHELEVLIDKFCMAARAIDPTISKFWIGRGGEDLQQPFIISMERNDGASIRRAGQ